MVQYPDKDSALNMLDVVEARTRPGFDKTISGWQHYLGQMLARLTDHLRPGHLVTFERMADAERDFFEAIHGKVVVPEGVGAVYIPHSVIREMLSAHPDAADHPLPPKHSDAGIVLASRQGDYRVVLNAVFALPPFAPAIDIYENGRLLAGYMFHTVDECVQDLTRVMASHLKPRK